MTWETGLKTDEKKWMTWESRILESRPTTPVTFEPSIYIIGLYCMTVYSMYHNNIQVRMNMGKPQTKPMVYHHSRMFFLYIYIYLSI